MTNFPVHTNCHFTIPYTSNGDIKLMVISVPCPLCMLHLLLFLDEINIQPHTEPLKVEHFSKQTWVNTIVWEKNNWVNSDAQAVYPRHFSFTCKWENAQVHQGSWIGHKCIGKIHYICIGALINSFKTVFESRWYILPFLRWFIPAFRATLMAFLCLRSTQNC